MLRIPFLFILLFSFNSCRTLKENDQYGFQFFIKSVYNDSDVVKSGSLLSEPFQVRNNKLPCVITIELIDSHYRNAIHAQIVPYLPARLNFVKMEDLTEDLKQLETEKIIVFESSKPFNSNEIGNLGYLTILQVYTDSTRTKVYIHYTITDAKKKGYVRCSSEIQLIKNKWKETKSVVYERN